MANGGGTPVLSKGICWSINAEPTIADNKTTEEIDAIEFSSIITRLNPDTKYYTRAYASNIAGIGYVSHPYPMKRSQPWEPKWEKDFGFASEKYPIFCTEIGFALKEEKGVHIPVFGDEDYGKRITDYFDKKDISYMVWVFDPDWAPMMFKDWNYEPTRQGKFFKTLLQKQSAK